jgi:hypothetical protein
MNITKVYQVLSSELYLGFCLVILPRHFVDEDNKEENSKMT